MKQISHDDRLKALALAVTANDLYRQACQFEKSLQRLLGVEDEFYGVGKLGDVIYEAEKPLSVAIFDSAIQADGFTVSDDAG